jgi:hypothetical protein
MHFFYQRSVHDDYDGEEGTAGRREGAVDKSLRDLTTKRIDLIWLEAEKERRTKPKPQWRAIKPGENGLHGYVPVAGHQSASGPSYTGLLQGELENKIADTRKQIKDIETKLQREGVVWITSSENGLPKLVYKEDQAKVVYDHDPRLQELTKVTIRNGKLYILRPLGPGMLAAPFKAVPGSGQTQEALLDTGQSVTEFSGAGVAIYIMSGDGNLHVSGHSPRWRHHSSLLAGGPVAGAGEIKVSRGCIK